MQRNEPSAVGADEQLLGGRETLWRRRKLKRRGLTDRSFFGNLPKAKDEGYRMRMKTATTMPRSPTIADTANSARWRRLRWCLIQPSVSRK